MSQQEPDPPDLRLMVLAILVLFHDLAEEELRQEIRERLVALRRAVERFKDTSL